LYLRGAVAPRLMRNFAIQLDELGVIYVSPETGFHGFEIGPVSVARYLYTVCQPVREIADKLDCRRGAPITDAPGRDQLGFGIDSNPCPDIAGTFRGVLGEHNVARLRVAERPNFIELNALAR